MLEIVLLFLGICAIFKEEIKTLLKKPKELSEEQKRKKKENKEEFDKLMNYSYEQAITKRGDN